MTDVLSLAELQRRLADPAAAEACSVVVEGAPACLIVDLRGADRVANAEWVQPACTVIGVGQVDGQSVPNVVDVLADSDAELEVLCAAVTANPIAASVLVQVLRHNATATVADGLLVESLAYSTLQHGAEFKRWLDHRPAPRTRVEPAEPVALDRTDDRLFITLNRPLQRNAFSAALRDALCAALELPLQDQRIREVVLAGAGAAFCAGGDLDEFGTARDAANAHATRMTRSAAALLYRLRDRVTCHLHGACIGAGIELPAFAARVRARQDAFFQLPEVAMGLVPGAGGTVSITRRIGRLRTAALALTGTRIDAQTALDWGLVDEIVDAFD
jgi:enoyl-CoA hydratase